MYTIDSEGPALKTSRNWRTTGTIWTDGPRLDSGGVGAACTWRTREGWTSKRFHLGHNKEAFDAEVFDIYQALRIFEARQRTGQKYTIFSDSQPVIRWAMMDALGPGQQWARAIIEVASRLKASGNGIAVRPVGPGSQGSGWQRGRGRYGQGRGREQSARRPRCSVPDADPCHPRMAWTIHGWCCSEFLTRQMCGP